MCTDSPPRQRHDVIRDSEARIRALTREVGTLREDLRREGKRRERAVAQARQNDDLRGSAEAKVHELEYANKRLVAELAAAREVAHAAAERDRRAMRALRQGLAAVEDAVAARAHRGRELLGAAYECMEGLRQQLLEPGLGGVPPLAPALELQVTVTLGEAMRALGQMEQLLVGRHDDGVGGGASGGLEEAATGGDDAATDVPSSLQGLSYNLEKAELQEQVSQLRAQVIVLKASAEQAAAAAAAAAGAASAAGAAERRVEREASASAEALQMHADLQQARHENENLRRDVAELEQRLHQQEQQLQHRESDCSHLHGILRELHGASVQAEQQASDLQEQLLGLQAAKVALERENAALQGQLRERERQQEEQARRLQAMQGTISEHHQDVRAALQLISHRDSVRGALPRPSAATVGGSGLPSQQQRLAIGLPPAAARPLSAGPSVGLPGGTTWAQPAAGLGGTGVAVPLRSSGAPSHWLPSASSRSAGGAREWQESAAAQPLQRPGDLPRTSHPARPTASAADEWQREDAVAAALQAARAAAAAASLASTSAATPTGAKHGCVADAGDGPLSPGAQAVVSRAAMRSVMGRAAAGGRRLSDDAHQVDQLHEDMTGLDQEIEQLETMLKRAALGLAR